MREIPDREHLMNRWDAWRKYIADGGRGSWPRDEFEMLLDYFYGLVEHPMHRKKGTGAQENVQN